MATVVAMPVHGLRHERRQSSSVGASKKANQVARGEVIAEIETDKATVEMEAYASGVLGKIIAEEGASIPVGRPHRSHHRSGEEEVPPLDSLVVETTQEAPCGKPQSQALPVAAEIPTAAPEGQTGRVAATPIARRTGQGNGNRPRPG